MKTGSCKSLCSALAWLCSLPPGSTGLGAEGCFGSPLQGSSWELALAGIKLGQVFTAVGLSSPWQCQNWGTESTSLSATYMAAAPPSGWAGGTQRDTQLLQLSWIHSSHCPSPAVNPAIAVKVVPSWVSHGARKPLPVPIPTHIHCLFLPCT